MSNLISSPTLSTTLSTTITTITTTQPIQLIYSPEGPISRCSYFLLFSEREYFLMTDLVEFFSSTYNLNDIENILLNDPYERFSIEIKEENEIKIAKRKIVTEEEKNVKHHVDLWKDEIYRFLNDLQSSIELSRIVIDVPRPSFVPKSIKIKDILKSDSTQRFHLHGQQENLFVGINLTSIDVDKLKETWRVSILNYLSQSKNRVTLGILGTNVPKPQLLNSKIKLIETLKDDPLKRFELHTNTKNEIIVHIALSEEEKFKYSEKWRVEISNYLFHQLTKTNSNNSIEQQQQHNNNNNNNNKFLLTPSINKHYSTTSWTLTEIGAAVTRPSQLPKFISLHDVLISDPLHRFHLNGFGNNITVTFNKKVYLSAPYGCILKDNNNNNNQLIDTNHQHYQHQLNHHHHHQPNHQHQHQRISPTTSFATHTDYNNYANMNHTNYTNTNNTIFFNSIEGKTQNNSNYNSNNNSNTNTNSSNHIDHELYEDENPENFQDLHNTSIPTNNTNNTNNINEWKIVGSKKNSFPSNDPLVISPPLKHNSNVNKLSKKLDNISFKNKVNDFISQGFAGYPLSEIYSSSFNLYPVENSISTNDFNSFNIKSQTNIELDPQSFSTIFNQSPQSLHQSVIHSDNIIHSKIPTNSYTDLQNFDSLHYNSASLNYIFSDEWNVPLTPPKKDSSQKFNTFFHETTKFSKKFNKSQQISSTKQSIEEDEKIYSNDSSSSLLLSSSSSSHLPTPSLLSSIPPSSTSLSSSILAPSNIYDPPSIHSNYFSDNSIQSTKLSNSPFEEILNDNSSNLNSTSSVYGKESNSPNMLPLQNNVESFYPSLSSSLSSPKEDIKMKSNLLDNISLIDFNLIPPNVKSSVTSKKILLKDWFLEVFDGFPAQTIQNFINNFSDEGFLTLHDILIAYSLQQLSFQYLSNYGFKIGHYNRLLFHINTFMTNYIQPSNTNTNINSK